jgi:hypothetical protein
VLVAKRIGDISGVSAERAGAVVEMIDKHIKAKHPKKAQQLQELLSKGITQAHKVAFEKSQNNGPKAGPEPKKPGKTTGASPVLRIWCASPGLKMIESPLMTVMVFSGPRNCPVPLMNKYISHWAA